MIKNHTSEEIENAFRVLCNALRVDYEFDDDNRRIYFEDVSNDRVWLLNNDFLIPERREKVMTALT